MASKGCKPGDLAQSPLSSFFEVLKGEFGRDLKPLSNRLSDGRYDQIRFGSLSASESSFFFPGLSSVHQNPKL